MKRLALLISGLILCAAGALCLGQAGNRLSEADARMILQQMSKKLTENKSLSARFLQERRLTLFNDVLRTRGVFYYQSPGRIRWELVEPYSSIVLMHDTGRMEKFDVFEGRVQRVRTDSGQVLAEVLSRISSWLRGDIEKALEDFVFHMFPGKTYRLVLKPRSEALASMLSNIEFEIDPKSYLVQAISLWENENDLTIIRFLDQRVNESLPDRLFDLNNPLLLKQRDYE